MRRFLTCVVTLALAVSTAFAAEEPKDRLLRLFNARLAENPRRFADAMREVMVDAREGLVLHQFAVALVAQEPNVPVDVRQELTDDLIATYRRNRSKIELAAKNRGNPFAWYMLALDAPDFATRLACLRKAAEGNNEQGLNELGVVLVEKARADVAAGLAEVNKLVDAGAEASVVKAARQRLKALNQRLLSAQKESAGLFQRAVDKMDANGSCNLGSCLLYGYGVPKDPARALTCFKSAAKEGHPQAMTLLGECYRDGIGGAVDFEAAAASFKTSADLGNADGLYNYGRALMSGQGVDRDPKLALDYLRRAAFKRHLEAMFSYADNLLDDANFPAVPTQGLVGDALDQARASNAASVEKRYHEAVTWWYHCATEFNHPPSMERLADCFLNGRGVEKREDAAVYWFFRAAKDFRYVPAMFRMAECCEAGCGGLTASRDDANWWRTSARAQEGDRCAKIWLAGHDPHRFDRLVISAAGAKQ